MLSTVTQSRILFLKECLEKGFSKREAARLLHEKDPEISLGTAETLVYTVFSGQYRKSMKGIKKPRLKSSQITVSNSKTIQEEDLL